MDGWNKMNDQEKKEYEECEKAWKETLIKFGVDRPILPFEKVTIARMIKQYDWKSVLYALTGARFEEKTQSFDPAKYVSLTRVSQPHLFERFINLAAQRKKKPQEIK